MSALDREIERMKQRLAELEKQKRIQEKRKKDYREKLRDK